MDDSVLKDYLYNGLSFSTFKFDKAAFYALKYHYSKTPIFKAIYYSKLKKIVKEYYRYFECTDGILNYYINQTDKAILSSSLLLGKDKKNIALYKKINGKDAEVMSEFTNLDLPSEIYDKKIAIITLTKEKITKYRALYTLFNRVEFITLKGMNLSKDDIAFDAIKLKLIQDENEIYFVDAGIYSNFIINVINSQNKIGINL